MGTFFKTVGAFMPPPPPIAQPPLLWGDEAHVRELFCGTGVELEFRRESVEPAAFASADEAFEWTTTRFGPLIMARQMLEASGRWDELRAALTPLYRQNAPLEYLVILGRKTA